MAFAESKSHGHKTKVFYRKFAKSDIAEYNIFLENNIKAGETFEQKISSWKIAGGKKSGKIKPEKDKLINTVNGKVFEVLNFLNNINYFIKQYKKLNIKIEEVETIYILFVSNCYYDEIIIAEKFAEKFIEFPHRVTIKLEFKTHFDLLIDLINVIKPNEKIPPNSKNKTQKPGDDKNVADDDSIYGKRSGHPVLDLIREFNRHVFLTQAEGASHAPKTSLKYEDKKREENQQRLTSIFDKYNEIIKIKVKK